MQFKMRKRGQITVFVIIGLIVLLTYFLLSYYKKESIEETELIMPELIPVQNYVIRCTENLAREAIDLVGLNGGYVYFPPWISNDASSYLQLSPIPELKNPYWWHDGISTIPRLNFIADQISEYAENNMEACIDNFTSFGDTYEVIELGNFEVMTIIGEEDITVKTTYPIEVKDKFNKTLAKLQRFPVIIPIRLKKVYEMATKIMERENKDYFIEKRTIDLMSLDDDEIPTVGVEVRCGKKRWLIDNVENKLKKLLQVNLPYIKIEGTKFAEDALVTPYQLQDTNPYSQTNLFNESYYYYHYIWDISDIKYPNMHVSFNYEPKWGMDLYARPKKGRFLESNSQKGSQILSLLCFHIWHFTYDVIFPVKATIVDDETKNNEAFSFTFAFKAQINHNTPDRRLFAIESFETRDTYHEEEYCADLRNEITIYAQDKITTNFVRNTNITFICGRYRCDMGKTKSYWKEDPSGTPKLKTRFPYCSNGIIRGRNPNYEESETFIQTGRRLDTLPNENIGHTFTLMMTPIKTFNFTILKHQMINNGLTSGTQLEENEKAMITVKNKEEDFVSYSAYPIEKPIKLLDKKNLNYDLEIFVMDNETIKGGYKNKEWYVSKVSTRLGNNITFHVIEKDFKEEEEQYLFFAGLEQYSEKFKNYLQPEIK